MAKIKPTGPDPAKTALALWKEQRFLGLLMCFATGLGVVATVGIWIFVVTSGVATFGGGHSGPNRLRGPKMSADETALWGGLLCLVMIAIFIGVVRDVREIYRRRPQDPAD